MTTTLIISKNSVSLELVIDGKVQVNPLPDNVLGMETLSLLAETFQVQLNAHLRQNKDGNLLELVRKYFEKKGFEVRQKRPE